jgi:hypothetical protein
MNDFDRLTVRGNPNVPKSLICTICAPDCFIFAEYNQNQTQLRITQMHDLDKKIET